MPNNPSPSSAIGKARAYCARQERAQQEMRDKLYGWGEHRTQVEAIIAQLIGEGFLNEARFAEHFAVSKFRQKGWGMRKIEHALRTRQVSEPCIVLGLKAVGGEEVTAQLEKLVAKRWEKEKETDVFRKGQKVIGYFLRRGYGLDEIQRALANQ